MSHALVSIVVLAATPVFAQFLTPDETVKMTPSTDTSPAIAPAPVPNPQTTQPAVPADGYFADLAAYGRDRNVILTWHLVHGRAIDKRIQIYRFTEEPRVIHDISRGTLIAKLSGEINLYEDQPPSRGTYYYAVFVETNRGLEPASFNSSRNLVGPVSFQSGGKAAIKPPRDDVQPQSSRPEFASEELDNTEFVPDDDAQSRRGINSVIRRTFLKGDYDEAIRALKPFLRNKSARVRAKAMFYIGMSRYRLEQYDRAIKYFEHPLTKKYYRRNAEFWINRTSENLR
ncbi:MAG: hypothetical protein U1F16_11835 [Turneriella sp.]